VRHEMWKDLATWHLYVGPGADQKDSWQETSSVKVSNMISGAHDACCRRQQSSGGFVQVHQEFCLSSKMLINERKKSLH
jgi:hypothetical protein